jgi:chromosome segregation ATPase
MEELIKTHQQAKQKQAQTNAELNNLQAREKELKGKISMLTSSVNSAEQQISRALTSESLEKARANVKEAQKNESDVKTLLNNIERAINDIKSELPGLHNDVYLAEVDIWMAQKKQLIQEIKSHTVILQLIMKAYVAYWQTGYQWELEHFIREEIMNADFHINPEVMAQLKDEMTKQIWPETDTQILSQ